jgi:threonine dehydrogenase-like Zn-dependent dehydrogenase
MADVLTISGPRQLGFSHEDHERPLEPGEVRLRSVLSGISHGTEMNLYRGTSPFSDHVFDPELRVFVPGNGLQASYPQALGYEMVAEVVEAGPGVDHVRVGDLVHTGTPHQDWTIVRLKDIADFGYPLALLPPGADPRPGIFVSIGSVALQAIHDARIKVGDAVAVSGLGAIGLLVVQLALRNGARQVIGLDPVPARRELADSLGATLTLNPSDGPAIGARVKAANTGRGVDTAIETSGVAAGLHGAIASVTVGGRVVSVGYYQGDAVGLRLGEEWHHNRPTMVSSMGVWGCPHRDYPAWDRQRLTDTVVSLLYDHRALDTAPLISDIVPFHAAADAYGAIDDKGANLLKVALAYPGSEHLIVPVTDQSTHDDPVGTADDEQ